MSAAQKSAKSVPASSKPAHLARFHKSRILQALVRAHDELLPLVEEAETAGKAVHQARSEILPANSPRPEGEKEERGLQYYGWVIRLEAVIAPLTESINNMHDPLAKARAFLDKDGNWKTIQGHHLCQLIELNVLTACSLLKRALKALQGTEYEIGDANLCVSLGMLLRNKADEAFNWLDGVPQLPVTDGNEDDWQVVKSDRITARLIAHLLTFVDRLSGNGCISFGDSYGEASRAARMMREKGWDAAVQQRTSPGITPGIEIRKPRGKASK